MSSSAFRSHLMQQFAAAASRQSQRPLALAPIYGDSSSITSRQSTPSPPSPRRASLSSAAGAQAIRSAHLQASSPSTSPPRHSLKLSPRDGGGRGFGIPTIRPRSLSSITATSSVAAPAASADAEQDAYDEREADERSSIPDLQHSFQSLLRTRRTISNMKQPDPLTSPPNLLSAAITRAVQCAVEAPNHKRTEPYTFTRLISPSATTEALADVCYHVSLRRMRERQKGSEKSLLAEAERKRERWRSIPAFLVASVGGMPDQIGSSTSDNLNEEEGSEYAELPFVPPATERQLEDYAATCAAVQNVLLSLHSEQLGSKWATGPVIRTKAFRDVLQLRNDGLVVGLVMVGVPKRIPRSPRRRRELVGDVLRDV